jgi:hypothetical protein
MRWNQTKNQRMLLMSSGLLLLGMALVGPRSIWGLLGIIPLLGGLIGPGPLFQISGQGNRHITPQ